MSINGKSPAELTEIALRSVLFGEPKPFADQHMGFATDMPDPLAPLRTNLVSEEIMRPLTELLLTDFLLGSQRATRIVEFRLSVPVQWRRSLTLAWEPVSRYTNLAEPLRTISGVVNI